MSELYLETIEKNFEQIKHWLFFNIPVWMPGSVVSFDPKKQTAVIKLLMQSLSDDTNANDATQSIITYAPLQDVPVCFQSGGGIVSTFSLKEGDQGIVLFSNRNLDNWKLRGDVEVPMRGSYGDLQNGVFLPGIRPWSKPQGSVPEGYALQDDQGNILFHVSPSGDVEIKGKITAQGDLITQGKIQSQGDITTQGDVKTNTVSLDQHKHMGVETGDGVSGPPQPSA